MLLLALPLFGAAPLRLLVQRWELMLTAFLPAVLLMVVGTVAMGWGLLHSALALRLLRRPAPTVAGASPRHA